MGGKRWGLTDAPAGCCAAGDADVLDPRACRRLVVSGAHRAAQRGTPRVPANRKVSRANANANANAMRTSAFVHAPVRPPAAPEGRPPSVLALSGSQAAAAGGRPGYRKSAVVWAIADAYESACAERRCRSCHSAQSRRRRGSLTHRWLCCAVPPRTSRGSCTRRNGMRMSAVAGNSN